MALSVREPSTMAAHRLGPGCTRKRGSMGLSHPIRSAGLFKKLSSPSLGVFLGGLPSGQPTGDVLPLSVAEAIRRALDHNLGVLMAEQELGRARGLRWKALSGLLPNINGRIAESRQQTNLEAFGFGSFGNSFAGVPSIVGPFNVFDARVYVSQAVVDLGALHDARSEAHNVEAARYDSASARDLVIHVAADAYILALAASARADSARA